MFNSRKEGAQNEHIFFHPDYTVGPGVSPGQPLAWVADFTASGELHPALKTSIQLSVSIIHNFGENARGNFEGTLVPSIPEIEQVLGLDAEDLAHLEDEIHRHPHVA